MSIPPLTPNTPSRSTQHTEQAPNLTKLADSVMRYTIASGLVTSSFLPYSAAIPRNMIVAGAGAFAIFRSDATRDEKARIGVILLTALTLAEVGVKLFT